MAWGEILNITSLQCKRTNQVEDKNLIYNLIALELTSGLDSQQKEELQSWIERSPENLSEYNEVVRMLDLSDRLVAMKKIDAGKDLLLVKKKLNPARKLNNWLLNFQRVAAILILPLLIYTAWILSNRSQNIKVSTVMKSSETAYGVRSQIILSDGTKVWLNSGTKLSYPEEFSGDSREVKLTGEAYFQVESDKNHPFFVDLNGYKVKATGTKFNISNYQNDNVITAYLEHGKISWLEYLNEKQNEPVQLKENDIIVLNKAENKYKLQNTDGRKYLAWIDGKLVFKNDKTEDVAVRLGRWFNADIIFDEKLSQSGYVFTATFKQESLEEALKLLSYSTPISFKIIQGTQQPDSSFSKRKVIITKK
ncbi:MAG: FecR domain-containing protein [Mariniphaga sp.]